MKEVVPVILLAVQWGADVNESASAYVEAFNKCGSHIILSYHTRQPHPQELTMAEKQYDGIKKVDGKFQVMKKIFDGTEEKKELFVLVPDKTQKMPEHIVKMRLEAECAKNKDLKDRMKNGE